MAVSSTEVRLTWLAPLASQQNGDLLGYKIFYVVTNQSTDREEMEVVPASHLTHSLPYMDMFTEYRLHIVAFNPAGDGPRSAPVTVRTLEGIPSSPGPLRFVYYSHRVPLIRWHFFFFGSNCMIVVVGVNLSHLIIELFRCQSKSVVFIYCIVHINCYLKAD